MRSVFFLLFILAIGTTATAQKTFDEKAFFTAMASDELAVIDAQLKVVAKSSIKEKEAYEGALLMRKAGLLRKVKQKLSTFKDGHGKLQDAIAKEPANASYRFLRLIIQENAPKVLNYNDDIAEDSKHVEQAFTSFSPTLQGFVIDYGKKSKALQVEKPKA